MNVINNHFCIIRITAKGLTLSRPSSQKGRYKTLKMFHVAGTKPPKTVRQVVLAINCFVYHCYLLQSFYIIGSASTFKLNVNAIFVVRSGFKLEEKGKRRKNKIMLNLLIKNSCELRNSSSLISAF